MAIRYSFNTTNPVMAEVDTTSAIALGDLVAQVSGEVISAADFTWTTNLATTQENFATAFLGISGQTKLEDVEKIYGNSVANQIRIDCSGIYEGDYTGGALVIGDYVGPSSAASVLLPQSLVKVATAALAIGRVVESLAGNGTVKFQLLSSLNSVSR
jgi:hypothetical protein